MASTSSISLANSVLSKKPIEGSSAVLTSSDMSKTIAKASPPSTSLTQGALSRGPMASTSSSTTLTSGTTTGHVVTASSSGAATASKGLLTTSHGGGAGYASAIAVATPMVAGVALGAIATGLYGASNMVKYAKNEKTGGQAVKDTVKGGAGVGVSAGLGVAAGNAVAGTALALGTTVAVPVVAAVAVTYAGMRIWHGLFFK